MNRRSRRVASSVPSTTNFVLRGHRNVDVNSRRSQMSSAQKTSNKATLRRFEDAVSTGDAELISKTIDEDFEPDVLIRTPLPVEATGRKR
jgi:hypothetical protein